MRDILMFCENAECPCEDICCQECRERISCEKRCGPIKFKERIYSSDSFLVEMLDKLADKYDNWLIAVAAERIRSLANIT